MSAACMEGDVTAEMLERRWFAAFKAASAARAECEALLEAIEMTEAAWAESRKQLTKLESLRDALGEELAELDGSPRPCGKTVRAIASAA